MNHQLQLLSLLILLVAGLSVVLASSEADGSDSWDRYRVLSDRNIFVRNRQSSQVIRPELQPTINPVDSADQYLVLTGIVQKGLETIAFIEDTRSRKTIKVAPGNQIGNGKLIKITLDNVEYECEGQIIRIGIGSTLMGSAVSRERTSTAVSSQQSVSADSSGSTDQAEAASSDVLERMRERREREAGR